MLAVQDSKKGLFFIWCDKLVASVWYQATLARSHLYSKLLLFGTAGEVALSWFTRTSVVLWLQIVFQTLTNFTSTPTPALSCTPAPELEWWYVFQKNIVVTRRMKEEGCINGKAPWFTAQPSSEEVLDLITFRLTVENSKFREPGAGIVVADIMAEVWEKARTHIRQVFIKFRITARQPIAGRLDTSSPPANRRPAAQDSGVWHHTTAERTVVCLVATRGTDTAWYGAFFRYQKFCDFCIIIIACEVYSLKRNRVW